MVEGRARLASRGHLGTTATARIPDPPMDAPADEFTIEEHRREGLVVLRCRGDLDLASADELAARLRDLSDELQAVLLDLDELDFMDSSGLRVVLQAAETSREGGWQFAMTPGSEAVQRLLESAGVADRLPIERAP
jgi:anti-sigma B factor antagonist